MQRMAAKPNGKKKINGKNLTRIIAFILAAILLGSILLAAAISNFY
jgi:hypothetical protein